VSKRKMLAAEEDLANRVAKLAEKRGLTVYQTVNDMLEQALRAEEQGLTLKEAVDRGDKMDRARDMGLTFTVEHLYYQVVDSAFGNDKQRAKDLWRDMGFWYGKYFLSKGDEPFKTLTDALTFLTLGSQFHIEQGKNGQVIISCINEKYTKGYTQVFAVFIEAAFQVLGYKTVENETDRGIIQIKFEKE
jgi:hypothetical protein